MVAVPDVRVALGTNKGQSVFGSFSALVSYWRSGRVNRMRVVPTFVAAGLGAFVGAKLVLALDPSIIRPLVLVLLLVVAASFALRSRRSRSSPAAEPRRAWPIAEQRPALVAVVIGFVLGAYDGFFGPGVGTFLIAAYSTVFGDDLTHATANAKVANFASNLASMVTFAIAGTIRFELAIPMALAQIAGGALGARAAIRGGERFVRSGVIVVTLALVARLGWQIVGR
jgi:uncharacterized membrane protein YfcA